MAPSEISHYRIIRKLGAGGMGEVFLAEDSTLGRKVAIKMLSERCAGSHQARQRLINEAKAAAALDHPNICSIHEVGEEDDRVFIVMQYIDGQSLAERIRTAPAASRRSGGHRHTGGASAGGGPRRRRHPSRHQTSEHHRHAARTAEGAGFRTREDRAARSAGCADDGASDGGREPRLARRDSCLPSSCAERTIDARSDIFSLGVTLYECATGRSAFERGTPLEVSMRVVTDTPPPPSELNPAVPPASRRDHCAGDGQRSGGAL